MWNGGIVYSSKWHSAAIALCKDKAINQVSGATINSGFLNTVFGCFTFLKKIVNKIYFLKQELDF